MTGLLGTEITQTPVFSKSTNRTAIHSFQPFGWAPQESGMACSYSGYKSECAQIYMPGNGNRSLDPRMMRFMQPDRLGPFGEGGLNVYAHCRADPVSNVDRDGYMPLRAWLKTMVGAGVVETTAGLAMVHWGSRVVGDVGTGVAIQGVATTVVAFAPLASITVFRHFENVVKRISDAFPDWLATRQPHGVDIELRQMA